MWNSWAHTHETTINGGIDLSLGLYVFTLNSETDLGLTIASATLMSGSR